MFSPLLLGVVIIVPVFPILELADKTSEVK